MRSAIFSFRFWRIVYSNSLRHLSVSAGSPSRLMITLTTIKLTYVFLLPCQDTAGPLQCQLYVASISDLKKGKFVLRKCSSVTRYYSVLRRDASRSQHVYLVRYSSATELIMYRT